MSNNHGGKREMKAAELRIGQLFEDRKGKSALVYKYQSGLIKKVTRGL